MATYPAPINFGEELAKRVGVPGARASLIRPESKSQVAITHLTSKAGLDAPTAKIIPEKAFALSLHLIQPVCNGWGTWIDGRYHPVSSWPAGGVGIYDLESDPIALRPSAFDCVQFHLPRTTLDAFTEQHGLSRIEALPFVHGARDSVLHHLALLCLPSIGELDQLCDLFWDHFALILCSHIVHAYGKVALESRLWQGGLAPWQKKRALEVLRERLSGGLRLQMLSEECGLSSSHFARSFRKTFGTSVHRYFILLKIEKAKSLLSHSGLSLVDIALECGFPDQAGLCRTFASITGTSPGRWRREQLSGDVRRSLVHPSR